MKYFAAAAVLASVAVAQLDPSTINPCILTCATQGAQGAGCSGVTDFACICASQSFVEGALQCIQSQCPDQVEAATALQGTLCAGQGGAAGASGDASAATPSATDAAASPSESPSEAASASESAASVSASATGAVASASSVLSSVQSGASNALSSVGSKVSSVTGGAAASSPAASPTSGATALIPGKEAALAAFAVAGAAYLF